ncbi:MAG: hypothetical protein Kow00122_07800 [Thermoleophilia bacterium]
MHIAEGILPAEWALAWSVPAAVATAAGVRSLQKRTKEEPAAKPLVAMMGAAVFAVSLMPIPVPVAGSVSHPAGTPLAAIVVGPLAAVVLAAISLLLQALFFAHGGLTTLGANIVSEGMIGATAGFVVFWAARRGGGSLFLSGFLAGFVGDLAVYLMTAVELTLGLFAWADFSHRFLALFGAFLPTQVPLAIVEGAATGAILRSLAELRPDIARRLGLERTGRTAARPRASSPRRVWSRRAKVVVGIPLATLGGVALWALVWSLATRAGGWVGLDEGVMEAAAEEAGRPAWEPFINTDVGGLLLIVFLLGGLAAGLMLGWIGGGMSRAAGLSGVTRPFRWALAAAGPAFGAAAVLLLVGPARIGEWGGDLGLFVFLIVGLVAGGAVGLAVRTAPGVRPRLRWGHAHGPDIVGVDHLAWHARGLGRVDARIKLALLPPLLFLNLLGGVWLSLAVLVVSLGLLLGLQRIRVRTVALRLAPAAAVGAVLIALRAVSIPGRALVAVDAGALGRLTLSYEGVLSGAELAVIVLAGVSLVFLLGLTTPLPALISGLRWYRTPPILIELGLMMYRYLFLFVEETGRIRDAHRLRAPGVPWRRALGGYGAMGAKLMARSYDRAQRVHEAQRLRGAK